MVFQLWDSGQLGLVFTTLGVLTWAASMAFAAWNLQALGDASLCAVLLSVPICSPLALRLLELICRKIPVARTWTTFTLFFSTVTTLTINMAIVVVDQFNQPVLSGIRVFIAVFIYTAFLDLMLGHIVYLWGLHAGRAHQLSKRARSYLQPPRPSRTRVVDSFEEALPTDADCVICLDPLAQHVADPMTDDAQGQRPAEGLLLLPCGHAFHACCFDRWLASGSEFCPTCRAPVGCRSRWEHILLRDRSSSHRASVPGEDGGVDVDGDARWSSVTPQQHTHDGEEAV